MFFMLDIQSSLGKTFTFCIVSFPAYFMSHRLCYRTQISVDNFIKMISKTVAYGENVYEIYQ